jgi:hypothetical protein
VEVSDIMRALESEVVDAVWATVEPLGGQAGRCSSVGLSPPEEDLGPVVFLGGGVLIRLTTGCSWLDGEAILERRV